MQSGKSRCMNVAAYRIVREAQSTLLKQQHIKWDSGNISTGVLGTYMSCSRQLWRNCSRSWKCVLLSPADSNSSFLPEQSHNAPDNPKLSGWCWYLVCETVKVWFKRHLNALVYCSCSRQCLFSFLSMSPGRNRMTAVLLMKGTADLVELTWEQEASVSVKQAELFSTVQQRLQYLLHYKAFRHKSCQNWILKTFIKIFAF